MYAGSEDNTMLPLLMSAARDNVRTERLERVIFDGERVKKTRTSIDLSRRYYVIRSRSRVTSINLSRKY